MFELFLARDLPADLTGRFMTSIPLAFSMLVEKRIAPAAPAAIAMPPGNIVLQGLAS